MVYILNMHGDIFDKKNIINRSYKNELYKKKLNPIKKINPK